MASIATDLARALDPVLFARAVGVEPDAWQATLLRSQAARILMNITRQGGKSSTAAMLAMHTALYEPGSLTLMVSPTQRQSGELFKKALVVYRALGRPVDAESESALQLILESGSRIMALPGKEGTIRSYSGVRLMLIDEAARVPLETYMAVRPMLAVSQGRLVALSTPFGSRGWFYHDNEKLARRIWYLSCLRRRLERSRRAMMDSADGMPVADLTAIGPAIVALRPEDLADVGEELAAYHAHFAPLFARREQRGWAAVYLRGLLLADVTRKNVEAMALRLLGAGPDAARQVRALQQFIGEGAWDDDAILAEHQRLVAETLGEPDGVLILDGSDVPKRGDHSAGAAAQWCGATGKTDNCQAGVFVGYASRQGYTLLDRRLFLPEAWFDADHVARWQACRIPGEVRFQTKAELGAELVEQVQARGELPASWLVCDEWFGRNQALLDRMDAAGLWYLAEVPRTTPVWPLREPTDGRRVRPRPRAWLPPRAASGKGRKGTHDRLHPHSPPAVPVETLVAQLARRRWRRYRILEGRKGPIVADFVALRALASRTGYREGLPGPEVWVLIRQPLPVPGQTKPPELKYYFSNAAADTPLAELIRIGGMRWPIECCFEEGKGELGMDQYELRFWRGWYHHMTLVILAHHFLVRLRQRLMARATTSAPPPGERARVREGGHDGPAAGDGR